MSTPTPTVPQPTFTLVVGDESHLIRGRARAVERAKTTSRGSWRPVELSRADGRVQMTFRHGRLETYQLTTRHGR